MRVQGDDRRMGGAINASIEMGLTEVERARGRPARRSEAVVFGKLGELGQAVVLKKADQIMSEFAGNVAQALGGPKIEAPEPVRAEQPAAERPGLWQRLRAWLRGR